MSQFDLLVESRRHWIDEFLRPWCQQASRTDLRRAELEWTDIAGKVDPQASLWTWAWGRFSALVSEGIAGVDETWSVTVTLKDGSTATGYPDSRQTEHGQLILVGRDELGETVSLGPFSIDDIADVERVEDA